MSESESLWSRFTTSIKRKGKKQSSKPTAFSNYAVQISPTCLISEKSKALVRIVSISRDGEFISVIPSSVGKAISNERQLTKKKKKKQLGFDAAEIKVKSRDANIAVKPRELEVCTEELPAKQISEDRRSWVRIAKAFRFPKAPDFQRNEPRVSQNPIRRGHAKDTKTPVIEQHQVLEIRQQNKVADSIPGPIEHPSKSSHTSAAVDSKNSKLWKFINFHSKVNCDANKGRAIKSSPLSQLPRADMNSSTTSNSQAKKVNTCAERKGTITGYATDEAEEYSLALNLSVLIIIMTCLVVFSNRLLAVLCTSIWWYLLPILREKNRVSAAAGGVNGGRSDLKYQRRRKFIERRRIASADRWW